MSWKPKVDLKRRTKKVVVHDASQYDGDFIPSNFTEALSWLQEKLVSIPKEHRALAILGIDSYSEYDSSYVRVEISFERPETDDEMSARIENEKQAVSTHEQRERADLARLKAQYGDA